MTATYYDTPDHALGRLGITLQRRVEHRNARWVLGQRSNESIWDLEHHSSARTVPPALRELLFALCHDQEPVPIGKRRIQQRSYDVEENGDALAEVREIHIADLDLNGRRVTQRSSILELYPREATPRQIKTLVTLVSQAGAELRPTQPSLADVLPFGAPFPPPLDPATSPGEHIRHVFLQHVHQVLRHDPGTRLGIDSEDLHRMRVATRRIRAMLRALRTQLHREEDRMLDSEVRWLSGELGAVRDCDVLMAQLSQETSHLDPADQQAFTFVLSRLEHQRTRARTRLLEHLNSPRYLALIQRLYDTAARCAEIPPDTSLQLIGQRTFDKLSKAVHKLQTPPDDEELHRLRILAKRARYVGELCAPKTGKHTLHNLKLIRMLQDVLGEHQDTVVIETYLQNFVKSSRSTRAAFVTGQVVARLRRRRSRLRKTFSQRRAKLTTRGKRIFQT